MPVPAYFSVYDFAAAAASAGLTTFRPPGVLASGFMITLSRVEGAAGSEKSCGIPKSLPKSVMVSRALSMPSRVRSFEAQAFFSASPNRLAALYPATTPLSRPSFGYSAPYSLASFAGPAPGSPIGRVEAAT